jgi:hypothetical protein
MAPNSVSLDISLITVEDILAIGCLGFSCCETKHRLYNVTILRPSHMCTCRGKLHYIMLMSIIPQQMASVVHVHVCFTWSRVCGHSVAGQIMDDASCICPCVLDMTWIGVVCSSPASDSRSTCGPKIQAGPTSRSHAACIILLVMCNI